MPLFTSRASWGSSRGSSSQSFSNEKGSKKKLFVISVTASDSNANCGRIFDMAVAEYMPKKEVNDILPHATLVNPKVQIPSCRLGERKIRQIHLQSAPSFADAWESFSGFVQSRCSADECPLFIAPVADAEVSFLQRELHLCGQQFPDWDFVCSLEATKKICSTKPAHLGDVARKLKLEHFARDSASARVKLLCEILNGMNRNHGGRFFRTPRKENSLITDLLKSAKSFDDFGDFDQIAAQPPSPQRPVLRRPVPQPEAHQNSLRNISASDVSSLQSRPVKPVRQQQTTVSAGYGLRSRNSSQSQHFSSTSSSSSTIASPSDAVRRQFESPSLPVTDTSGSSSDFKPSGNSTEQFRLYSSAHRQVSGTPILQANSTQSDSPITLYFVPSGAVLHNRIDCQGLQRSSNVKTCTVDTIPSGRRECNYTCKTDWERIRPFLNRSNRGHDESLTSVTTTASSGRAAVLSGLSTDDDVWCTPGGEVYHVTLDCWGLRNSKNSVQKYSRNSMPRGRRECKSTCRQIREDLQRRIDFAE